MVKFQALDWRAVDDSIPRPEASASQAERTAWKEGPRQKFLIDVFGVTADKQTVSARIEGFHPYFFVELPQRLPRQVFEGYLIDECLKMFLQNDTARYAAFNRAVNIREEEFLTMECEQVSRQRFGGYQWNRPRWFAKLVFTTDRVRKKVARMLLKAGVPTTSAMRAYGFAACHRFPLYENNVEPLLRFFHERAINPSGWIEIPNDECSTACPSLKETAIDLECESWTSIRPAEGDSIGPIVLCSFDIEADSAHGDFPLAIKNYAKLANDIVDVFIDRHLSSGSRPLTRTTIRRWLKAAFGDGEVEGISVVYTKREAIPPRELFTTPRARFASTDCDHDVLESAILRKECAEVLSRGDGKEDEGGAFKSSTGHRRITSFLEESARASKPSQHIEAPIRCTTRMSPEEWLHELLLRAKKQHTLLGKMAWRAYRRVLFRAVNLFLSHLLVEYPVKGDSVIQVGSVFWRFGEDRPFLKHLIALGTCDPIEDCIVVSCQTEREVLLKWAELIRTIGPDCLTGYNVFGFDHKFMFERAEELGCSKQFGSFSKVVDWHTRVPHYPHVGCEKGLCFGKGTGCKLIAKELTSAGLGENFLYFMDTPGITQFDLMKIVMRDYKLSSYKLDDVASTFINGDLLDMEVTETGDGACIVTDNCYGLAAGDYVRIYEMSSIGEEAIENGKKFRVVRIEEGDTIRIHFECRGAPPALVCGAKHQWGLAKDDVSPKDIFRLQKGTSADRAIVGKYCVQDCLLVLHLILKLQIIPNNIGMSTVCHVPLQYIFTRGQGVKTFSLVSNECRKLGFLVPFQERPDDVPNEDEEEIREGYEGAVVLPPKPGIYLDEPIAVLDYSSLYPSSMISENLCHTSIVRDEEYLGDAGAARLRAAKLEFKDISYDNYIYLRKGKTVKKELNAAEPVVTCRFIQPQKDEDGNIIEHTRGIIPKILKVLLAQRKATRKKIKTEKDPFVRSVLDGLQLAYKVTANSVYGSIGAAVNPIYMKDVAASTTATGRRLLNFAKEFVTGKFEGAECVYGDTDSIFISFHPKDDKGEPLTGKAALEKSIALGMEAGESVKPLLEAPHDLEYEKTFWPFILFSKKRYVGNKYETDPDKFKLNCMGIVLKRRDNAKILKYIYADVVDAILNHHDVPLSIQRLQASLRRLVHGEFPMDYLVITKSLRSHYDNPEAIVHKCLADRIAERDPGNKPEANDRIPYVYIDIGSRKVCLQGERVEHPAYIAEHNLRPDYLFYITNQIAKPVSQIYALIVEQLDGYKHGPGHFERIAVRLRNEGRDEVKVRKKIEELRMKEVVEILFDPVLRKERRLRDGNHDLTKWYTKKRVDGSAKHALMVQQSTR